jgi:hypothetical protein
MMATSMWYIACGSKVFYVFLLPILARGAEIGNKYLKRQLALEPRPQPVAVAAIGGADKLDRLAALQIGHLLDHQ